MFTFYICIGDICTGSQGTDRDKSVRSLHRDCTEINVSAATEKTPEIVRILCGFPIEVVRDIVTLSLRVFDI